MTRIEAFELFAVDLPFRRPFEHAAASRVASDSIFLKCITESGAVGFGETLPRDYVTGETREQAFLLLKEKVLPRLVGMAFESVADVRSFLQRCDGKAPPEWVSPRTPQIAAWAAVDLGLLDAVGREFNEPIRSGGRVRVDPAFRYSAVLSAGRGLSFLTSLLRIRLLGFRNAKLKVAGKGAIPSARLARLVLGRSSDLRVDANMAWEVTEAASIMRSLSRYGIHFFEQPVRADDIEGLAQLVRDTGLEVMVDEGVTDRDSLETLIARRACTAVNIRISKCGGLVASFNRCLRALAEGLTLQVGCQVGESSLLSAAQVILLSGLQGVKYGEGCFGRYLLREDPVTPLMQFGYGGRPPALPTGPGLGVQVDEKVLSRFSVTRAMIRAA
jgi:L-alanine-DL-glutamate epimerase-like enolase superfamily enzyme